jgi:hypothetical protein
MPRQQGNKRQIEITFPVAGLNRKASYRQQPPYSSPDLLNVRSIETIDQRDRGGSRPGLMVSHIDNLGGEVRLLSPMVLSLGDGFTNFSDTFSGNTMSTGWSQPSWATGFPNILTNLPAAEIDYSVASGDAVLSEEIDINTSKVYSVEALIVPWAGSVIIGCT